MAVGAHVRPANPFGRRNNNGNGNEWINKKNLADKSNKIDNLSHALAETVLFSLERSALLRIIIIIIITNTVITSRRRITEMSEKKKRLPRNESSTIEKTIG